MKGYDSLLFRALSKEDILYMAESMTRSEKSNKT